MHVRTANIKTLKALCGLITNLSSVLIWIPIGHTTERINDVHYWSPFSKEIFRNIGCWTLQLSFFIWTKLVDDNERITAEL